MALLYRRQDPGRGRGGDGNLAAGRPATRRARHVRGAGAGVDGTPDRPLPRARRRALRPLRPRQRRGRALRSRCRRRHHRARRGRGGRDRALAPAGAADRDGGRDRPDAQGGDRSPAADRMRPALRRLADRQHRPGRLGRLLQRHLLDGRGGEGAAFPDAAAGLRRLARGAGADARAEPHPLDPRARRPRRRRLRRHRRDGRGRAALHRPLPHRRGARGRAGRRRRRRDSAAGSSTARAGCAPRAPMPAPRAPRFPTAPARR